MPNISIGQPQRYGQFATGQPGRLGGRMRWRSARRRERVRYSAHNTPPRLTARVRLSRGITAIFASQTTIRSAAGRASGTVSIFPTTRAQPPSG